MSFVALNCSKKKADQRASAGRLCANIVGVRPVGCLQTARDGNAGRHVSGQLLWRSVDTRNYTTVGDGIA